MIRKELFKTRSDGVKLYRTYSDEDYRILQVETGQVFDEAIDVETSNYTYEETEEKIGATKNVLINARFMEEIMKERSFSQMGYII